MSVKHQFNDLDARPDFVPADKYAATIVKAEEKLSKQGNDMLTLTWELDKNKLWLFDHLVFIPKTAWRVDTFLKAIGQAPAKGEEVEINAEELVGCKATLELEVEPEVKDTATGAVIYPAKNKVVKYLAGTVQSKEDKDKLPF